jgi:sugar lactone lactonase YvrE
MNPTPRPQLEVLLTGLGLDESPRRHAGRLWFSDWLADEIGAVDPDGNRELIPEVPSPPFSFDRVRDGQMLIVSNSDGRRLPRREPGGALATHADLTDLVDRPWNEIVVDGRGNAYVNSIGFDMMAGEEFASGEVGCSTSVLSTMFGGKAGVAEAHTDARPESHATGRGAPNGASVADRRQVAPDRSLGHRRRARSARTASTLGEMAGRHRVQPCVAWLGGEAARAQVIGVADPRP